MYLIFLIQNYVQMWNKGFSLGDQRQTMREDLTRALQPSICGFDWNIFLENAVCCNLPLEKLWAHDEILVQCSFNLIEIKSSIAYSKSEITRTSKLFFSKKSISIILFSFEATRYLMKCKVILCLHCLKKKKRKNLPKIRNKTRMSTFNF